MAGTRFDPGAFAALAALIAFSIIGVAIMKPMIFQAFGLERAARPLTSFVLRYNVDHPEFNPAVNHEGEFTRSGFAIR